jgi:exonuclease VII small subunit
MTLAEAIKIALEKYRAIYRNVTVTSKTIAAWVEQLEGLDPEAVLKAFERAINESTRAELPTVSTVKKYVKEIIEQRERSKTSRVHFAPPVTRDDERRLMRLKKTYKAELAILNKIPRELEERFGQHPDTGAAWPHTADELNRIQFCQEALAAIEEVLRHD